MKVLVTGGAGFIGSSLVRFLIEETEHTVINVDKLTYAGNLESLSAISQSDRYVFEHIDICDSEALEQVFSKYQPDAVMHLAAESHVDRSIDGPGQFIQTNIIGTYNLLSASLEHWKRLKSEKGNPYFRFHHISTDEVYGDLSDPGAMFTETTAYDPSSPYSASKASSDHLVRAWNRTYGLPVLVTNCSNNYGPFHFPEKLIPLIILNALEGKALPVYGTGDQIRDWLFVEDHVNALYQVLLNGEVGSTYNIGGHNEKKNIDVVTSICQLLEKLVTDRKAAEVENKFGIKVKKSGYADLVTFVADRPGHDLRYAIDASKIEKDLGWKPKETFETGLKKTVDWYLDNLDWCYRVRDGSYRRIGLGNDSANQ